MAVEGVFTGKNTVIDITLKCFVLVLVYNIQFGYSYPFFGGKRYLRTLPIRRSYISIPLSQLHNEYQMTDYEDSYLPATQSDYDFTAYEKYPLVQYLGYYPDRNYYHEKIPRRNTENYEYFDDQLPQEDISEEMSRPEKGEVYPYGQETWYEEDAGKFDRNSEANKAFLQNLIMAQMYQDAKNQYPYGYDLNSDDYEDQHWFYGVPTTEVDDREKVKQYFKNKEDGDVLELESLARKKGKNKKQKEKENYKKQKALGIMEKPTKSRSKMTDDEYFDMQKQLIISSRKKGFGPATSPDNLELSKKQVYDSTDSNADIWNFSKLGRFNLNSQGNAMKKINLINEGQKVSSFSDSNINVESTSSVTTTTTTPWKGMTSTKKPIAVGQKEVVLPRPSNPVRRPFGEVSSRSLHQPSVYDTIKKLLNMEKDLQKEEMSQPQKRFVLNEDQLTSELSGLKKKSA